MGDLKGMRSFVGVLITQALMLFVVLGVGLFIFWFPNFESSQSRYSSIFGVFLIAFASALVFLMIWTLLIKFTEEWWSIIAVDRVSKWMIIPLYAAIGVAFLACIWSLLAVVKSGDESFTSTYNPIIPSLAVVLTTGIPLAASSFLTLLGVKRILTLKKNMRLFESSVSNTESEGLSRIRASINAEKGIGSTFARPEPKGFYFAGLTSKPWYESEELEWIAEFEDSFDDILAEATAIMSNLGDDIENYGYQGLNTESWKKVSLVANREENQENLAACPVTASLLKKIPGYPIFRDAMFSILEPGGVITPHRDYGNLFLTMHFGLIIPPSGYMEVANMQRNWQAGKALVFDSSYNHQAVNDSDQSRVILLVDFLNPDMSDQERQWVLDAPFWKA
ncbi:MAG: aspartyl/asparaginyl beta-hydroxylase domain-containing protein [Acidimicrobiales bacterium]|nr:hypothetical protein [Hyphomonadaceae bacterium]RZV43086.1 MAG: aspartyl/asparaginyl beta-hydroxylase domain-containing protein [Acidimicrobiales bacterium]